MSIRARLDDAATLWTAGRREGAFLIALVAVAATARRRFPDRKSVGDRVAFEAFLKAVCRVRLSVEFRGEVRPLEHVLYKWLRCELVHEGAMPCDIQFMPDTEPGVLSVRAGGSPEFVLKLSESWFGHLIEAVRAAPENA